MPLHNETVSRKFYKAAIFFAMENSFGEKSPAGIREQFAGDIISSDKITEEGN